MDKADQALIDRAKSCGGDPHLVNGLIGGFRGSTQAGMPFVAPAFREVLEWYCNLCELSIRSDWYRKPDRHEINDKFRNILKRD